jgi:hypothetical protein
VVEPRVLPDFVIIGAMKSATTSLFRWLDEQPETCMAHPKETRFFSDLWSNGPEWYAERFGVAEPGQLLGDASQNYTSPGFAGIAAQRMAELIPDARLIYIVRHPVERIRSHYRHEVQRRRELRTLVEAISQPRNPYVGHSSYATCLQPYVDRFPRERLLVVRFEDLVNPPASAWTKVLEFLSLTDRPLPAGSYNVTADKAQWTPAMAWAKRRGVINSGRIARVPKPLRRVAKRVFAREGDGFAKQLEASREPIPPALLTPMWNDVARLEAWLGEALWQPGDTPAHLKAAG